MEQDTQDKVIISKLFISKETVSERLNSLVELSKDVIHIVAENGDTLLEDPAKLNHGEKIFLLLLGNFFSWKSGLKETTHMSAGEIADKIGIPVTTLPAPMTTLLNNKIVTKIQKGQYQINFDNYKHIKEGLQRIRNKTVHSREGENGKS